MATLAALPAVRERLVAPTALVVQLRNAPRERPPESPPLPQPALREPLRIEIAPPAVVIAPELPVGVPAVEGPTIPGPVATAATGPPSPAMPEPPRFDMAYLRNPAPAYPPLSRRLKEQGRVLLKVLVAASGEARSVEVGTSSGYRRLDQAAIEAVRRWRFLPARRGNEAVTAWALVPIVFELGA